MKILIQNGRLVDPASGLDQIGALGQPSDQLLGARQVGPDRRERKVGEVLAQQRL